MHILIIEDDQNKLMHLTAFLGNVLKKWTYREARSYQSGLKTILNESFDLVLLDMSLPTFDTSIEEPGGRPRSFAGLEILSQMKKKKIRTPVVVVTQFDEFGEGTSKISLSELKADLKIRFSANYLETIYYSAARYDWQQELAQIIQKSGLKDG